MEKKETSSDNEMLDLLMKMSLSNKEEINEESHSLIAQAMTLSHKFGLEINLIILNNNERKYTQYISNGSFNFITNINKATKTRDFTNAEKEEVASFLKQVEKKEEQKGRKKQQCRKKTEAVIEEKKEDEEQDEDEDDEDEEEELEEEVKKNKPEAAPEKRKSCLRQVKNRGGVKATMRAEDLEDSEDDEDYVPEEEEDVNVEEEPKKRVVGKKQSKKVEFAAKKLPFKQFKGKENQGIVTSNKSPPKKAFPPFSSNYNYKPNFPTLLRKTLTKKINIEAILALEPITNPKKAAYNEKNLLTKEVYFDSKKPMYFYVAANGKQMPVGVLIIIMFNDIFQANIKHKDVKQLFPANFSYPEKLI